VVNDSVTEVSKLNNTDDVDCEVAVVKSRDVCCPSLLSNELLTLNVDYTSSYKIFTTTSKKTGAFWSILTVVSSEISKRLLIILPSLFAVYIALCTVEEEEFYFAKEQKFS